MAALIMDRSLTRHCRLAKHSNHPVYGFSHRVRHHVAVKVFMVRLIWEIIYFDWSGVMIRDRSCILVIR